MFKVESLKIFTIKTVSATQQIDINKAIEENFGLIHQISKEKDKLFFTEQLICLIDDTYEFQWDYGPGNLCCQGLDF